MKLILILLSANTLVVNGCEKMEPSHDSTGTNNTALMPTNSAPAP